MNQIENIIIHCSATPNGRPNTAEDIRRWHTDPPPDGRGWKHPGYHHVIETDGAIKQLQPMNDDEWLEPWEIANGVAGYNHNSIHICMIGTDKFTGEQWNSLNQLFTILHRRYPRAGWHGHRDFAPHKSCPGFDVQEWLTDPVTLQRKHLLRG